MEVAGSLKLAGHLHGHSLFRPVGPDNIYEVIAMSKTTPKNKGNGNGVWCLLRARKIKKTQCIAQQATAPGVCFGCGCGQFKQ
jgi:hypothetical protein